MIARSTAWQRVGRRLRRRAMAHRRVLAALLAALAVVTALRAVAPAGPPTAAVLVAARDLSAGTPLSAGDLVLRSVPADLVPDGALAPGETVAGRLLAGPVRRGETLTDARLVGPSLLAHAGLGPTGLAAPVRIADPEVAALLRPGDRVDVYAVDLGPGPYAGAGSDPAPGRPAGAAARDGPGARLVASNLLVLAIPAPDGQLGGPDGALVVFAATEPVARELARAAATGPLSVALRAPP